MGAAAANFVAKLARCEVYPAAMPFQASELGDFVLFKCTPQVGSAKGAFLNNSGLAMMVTTVKLPADDASPHDVVMTGDASFGSLVAIAGRFVNVTGITAIHHGSRRHGAQFDLPAPFFMREGRVAYSYGVRQNSAGRQVHCYGFPRHEAMVEYQASGWGEQAAFANSTAEGQHINADPPAIGNRGNLRMGAQLPGLNPAYNHHAFFTFRNSLT
jgi:hypothetical protein